MSAKKISVTPVRSDVVHTRFSDLVGIKGHKNYYVNLLSGRITYRKRGVRIATETTSIQEAYRKVDIALRTRSGQDDAVEASRGVTAPLISEIWAKLIEAKKVDSDRATLVTYRVSWQHGISEFWKNRTILEVNAGTLEQYRRWYLENHRERVFVKTASHFTMMMRYAFKHGYINKMPDLSCLKELSDYIYEQKQGKKVGRVITNDELSKLEVAANMWITKSPASGWRAVTVLKLASHTGMRLSEIRNLKWDNINEVKCIINVWSSKNKRWREVPMSEEVDYLMRRWRITQLASDVLVFPSIENPDKPMPSQTIDRLWAHLKWMAGVQGRMRFHDLRHTFATRTAEANWPPVTACEILDMSLNIYQRTYCKTSIESKHKLMASL